MGKRAGGPGRLGDVDARRASFEEAFDDLWGRTFVLAHRLLGSRDAAEDVAAEAMARAWLHWSRIEALPHRDGWVLRTATNLATDTVRRRPRFAAAAGGRGLAEEVALRDALVQAMVRLPTRQRQVVALRHLCDLSEADTAAALGLRTGTVGVHLHRGLAALRAQLGASHLDDGAPDALHA